MNKAQEKFGQPQGRAAKKVLPYMQDWIQAFIHRSPFLVMATSNANGDCDASPKGGKPGFVKVISEHQLLIPDVRGNKLFQSYENFETNPKVGLIFMIPGQDVTARVNGTVEELNAEQLSARGIEMNIFNPDDEARLLQGLLVTVEEAYPQCPRALHFSELWNTDQIAENQATPLDTWLLPDEA